MNQKLTVIIPFANEGQEVENTVKSVLEHSSNDVEIIVINDASDDEYDYESRLKKYPVNYICNEIRLGVAASRDLGVCICKTDYFLLLDAHMRFYESEWVSIIVNSLNKNPRSIPCAQTKVLRNINGCVVEDDRHASYWGAYVNLYSPIEYLEPEWAFLNWIPSTVGSYQNQIPCVLGAGYAASKGYWEHIHGLEGLMSYGSDEVLLSIKVWLEGGRCQLLPNVTIGHVYRQSSPYLHHTRMRIYNRLLIAFQFCPLMFQRKLYAIERTKFQVENSKAWKMFFENYEEIKREKEYYKRIATRTFSSFEKYNHQFKYKEKESIEAKDRYLQYCILRIMENFHHVTNNGLIDGRLGVVVLLYYFSIYTRNAHIKHLANSHLGDIISSCQMTDPLTISSGLLGVGWAISYLHQRGFVSGDINIVLNDIDKKVSEIAPHRMKDLNLEYGVGGILRYVICRLYDTKDSLLEVFSADFLSELYLKAKLVIEKDICTNCPETYVEYVLLFEKRVENTPSSIYDIMMLPDWNKYSKRSRDFSLSGLSGMCLEYILSQLEVKN